MEPVTLKAIESGQLVINAAYVLIGLGAFILGRMIMAEQETRAAQENLADQRDRKASNPLVKLARPFFTQYVVPIIRGKLFWDKYRKRYKRKIIAAGLREEFTPDEFVAFKLFNIVLFPLIGGFLRATDFLDVPGIVFMAMPFIGWFYPDLWVRGRMQERQKAVVRSMPFIVDLLALSTEAGLDFVGAIGKVVDKATPGPLVEEFSQLLKEIKVGSSRQEALREMAARIDCTEINSFVAILISADQMGASIGKILRQQSDQIRVARILSAEKAGAAATQKVLLVTMFLIVPAVFVMIIGPVGLGFLYPGN